MTLECICVRCKNSASRITIRQLDPDLFPFERRSFIVIPPAKYDCLLDTVSRTLTSQGMSVFFIVFCWLNPPVRVKNRFFLHFKRTCQYSGFLYYALHLPPCYTIVYRSVDPGLMRQMVLAHRQLAG